MRTALAIIALLALVACSPDKPASWRDDPGSNEYGPSTSVVWLKAIGAQTYHRSLCPRLEGAKIPTPRYGLDEDAEPCPVCQP